MYYVIYERYNEYNQFEGRWLYDVEEFRDIYEAHSFISDHQNNSDYRNFIFTKEVKFK